MRIISCIALGALAALVVVGQTGHRKVTQNKLSPTAETRMKLGGTAITIEYNAPSVRGRQIEGALVPYGQVWRMGADAATTMTTSGDILIGNLRVPLGVHTLYILPSESGWKLIVNKQTGQWGTEYSQAQDLGRVDMKVSKSAQPVEKMNISLRPGDGSSGTLELEWSNTKAVVPIKAS